MQPRVEHWSIVHGSSSSHEIGAVWHVPELGSQKLAEQPGAGSHDKAVLSH
jgi:hypothetical protein